MQATVESLAAGLRNYRGRPIRLMEVCGTHTAAIAKQGVASLLPESIHLVSGPGCPVCVTPGGYIDALCQAALEKDTTVLTFGDMMRVPGGRGSLMEAKARGGSVEMMYSPTDALRHAKAQPGRTFIVAALGFETTLPLYALLIRRLKAENIRNVRLFTQLKALMPCLRWLCEKDAAIDGFLGPGHVSAILGADAYRPFCERYRVPLAVAGFGYEHLVIAIHDLVTQISQGKHEARNFYPNVVSAAGNEKAQALIREFFVLEPSRWRGMGEVPGSGYGLAPAYGEFDAGLSILREEAEPPGCLCADVIIGRATPKECPMFGTVCLPQTPVGPCMVSSEGSCGIWYQHHRDR